MKRTISTFSRYAFLVLLLVALLGPLSSAHATDWSFTLIDSVERNGDEEFHETIHMAGTGTFNPEQGTASGGGFFAIFNAFDDADLGGPTFQGTWKVTEFTSWEPDGEPKPGLQGGTLQVQIMLFFKSGVKPENKGFTLGGPSQPVTLTITGDGINVDFFGVETFGTNHTGLAAFYIKKFHIKKP